MKLGNAFSLFLRAFALGAVTASSASANVFYRGPYQVNPPGETRKAAKVYLPNQYAQQSQWPLVVMLHGFSANAGLEDLYLGLRFRVSHRGFILVAPEGTKDRNGKPFWNATDFCCDFGRTGVNDVEYLTSVITQVQAQYHVDPRRIYLFGHSNGAFMANRLACDVGGRFAGIASLAGVGFPASRQCASHEPVSMLQIHAEDDPTILYSGTAQYPGARQQVDNWIERNRCTNPGTQGAFLNLTLSIPGDDATPETWKNCAEGTEVALWTIRPHTSRLHMPHIPLLTADFTDRVLSFLFVHQRGASGQN